MRGLLIAQPLGGVLRARLLDPEQLGLGDPLGRS